MKYQYSHISQAIDQLKSNGFTMDMSLPSNLSKFDNGEWKVDDFRITGVIRYEGNTDPADQAVVYVIESDDGTKGFLVSGYGISADNAKAEMLLKNLHMEYQK